ncbi:MAG: hypothetical protein ACREBC_32685, partial [Pyrinomonadaceae bacterium]
MNGKAKKLMALVAVVLTLCLFSLEQPTSAQEQSKSAQSAHSRCRRAKGKLSEVSNPTGTTGRITRGGILNGTTELVFTSGVLATPDPTTVSYTDDFTITTKQGQLKISDVGLFDFATGLFTTIGRINPTTSTGRFAGATGVLFTSGKTTDGGETFQSRITGEICLAHDDGEDDDGGDDS